MSDSQPGEQGFECYWCRLDVLRNVVHTTFRKFIHRTSLYDGSRIGERVVLRSNCVVAELSLNSRVGF